METINLKVKLGRNHTRWNDGTLILFIFYMSREEVIEVEGKITVLPSTMFRAELENGHQVLAHISKLRKHFIKITVGDIVKMEMSTQDLEKARIVYRLKNAEVNRNALSEALVQNPKKIIVKL